MAASGTGAPASRKLRFQVVFVSGEDTEYPASELNVHSPQTRGWQSPRFCEYPQEIGVAFLDAPAAVAQVQLLSHQSKIATKIELFVGQGADYYSSRWRRLGYLSLDNNERSKFKARELKSVYVDAKGSFLKLLIHKCHVNPHNLFNQVGLIAINVLGTSVSPSELEPFDDKVSGSITTAAGPTTVGARGAPTSVSSGGPARAPARREAGVEDLAVDMRLDPETAAMYRDIHAKKVAAVEDEDYDKAKMMKLLEAEILQVGARLAALHIEKQRSVEAEDFDRAATVKAEIDEIRHRIRSQVEAAERGIPRPLPGSGGPHRGGVGFLPPSSYGGASSISPSTSDFTRGAGGAMDGPGAGFRVPPTGAARVPGSRANIFPPEDEESADVGSDGGRGGGRGASSFGGRGRHPHAEEDDAEHGRGARNAPRGGVPASAHVEDPDERPIRGAAAARRDPVPDDDAEDDDFRGGPGLRGSRAGEGAERPSSRPIRPAPGGSYAAETEGAGEDRPLPALRGGDRASAPEDDEAAASSAVRSGARADARELEGVPNVADLPEPEPFSAEARKVSGEITPLVGEYVARCFFSKVWQLREAALLKMQHDLERYSNSPSSILQAACFAVSHVASKDPIAQVFQQACKLLPAAARLSARSARRGEVATMVREFALGPLVEKLGDNGAKNRESAVECLLALAGMDEVGAGVVAVGVMARLPKKQVGAPKPIQTRLQLLAKLVAEYGVIEDGVQPETLLKFSVDIGAHEHKVGEVRSAARDLTAELYKVMGSALEARLDFLRPKQREEYLDAFRKAAGELDGGAAGGGAGGGRGGGADDDASARGARGGHRGRDDRRYDDPEEDDYDARDRGGRGGGGRGGRDADSARGRAGGRAGEPRDASVDRGSARGRGPPVASPPRGGGNRGRVDDAKPRGAGGRVVDARDRSRDRRRNEYDDRGGRGGYGDEYADDGYGDEAYGDRYDRGGRGGGTGRAPPRGGGGGGGGGRGGGGWDRDRYDDEYDNKRDYRDPYEAEHDYGAGRRASGDVSRASYDRADDRGRGRDRGGRGNDDRYDEDEDRGAYEDDGYGTRPPHRPGGGGPSTAAGDAAGEGGESAREST